MHPAGVVITLERSFSGLETIAFSIRFQILEGSSLSSCFSALEKCFLISLLYF